MIKSEDLTFPKIKEKINKAGNLFYQYRACRRDAATISLFLEGGTNMPLEIGGRADKMGNRYEIRCILILTWTIYILAPFAITLGIMVCNKLRQPQNYIEAVDPDSVETPILEGVANREYYGRSATFIENKSTIEYGTEQGLSSLIYGEQGVSSLPIQDITGEYIDTDNEYMYYYSAEFVK